MVHELANWNRVISEKIADCRIFSVEHTRCFAERAGVQELHSFYVLDAPNWVNVIPVTDDGQVVLVEQFRHGIQSATLEIPGGMVDPEDAGSEHAALRELREETGFVPKQMIFLGRNHPNPAIQGNICDTFLALGVEQVETPKFQGTEEIVIKLLPLAEVDRLIAVGEITHSLVITAFYWLKLYQSSCK